MHYIFQPQTDGDTMQTRKYTRMILNAVQEGVLDRDTVIVAALNHMSESEVQDMCEANDFFPYDDEIDNEEEDPTAGEHVDNFNWVGSRHHY
jgi:hypothetical protein